MIETYSQIKGSGVTSNIISPLSEGSARVCQFPKAYLSALIMCSDFLRESREKSLMWSYQYGFKITIHDATNQTYSNNYYKTGIFDFGVYFDGSNSTLLSQLNANDFTLADPIISQVTAIRDGNTPTVMAYGFGIDTYKNNLYTRFLSGRNSRFGNATRPNPLVGSRDATDAEAMEYTKINKTQLISRPVSSRPDYYNKVTSVANQSAEYNSGFEWQGNIDYQKKINTAYSTGSLYTIFNHLHWIYGLGLKNTFIALNGLISGKSIYKGQWVELMEYFYVKDSVSSLQFNPQTFDITVNYSKKDATRPYTNIKTPLWVEVNLKGTTLQGSAIQSTGTVEIIKKSTDVYALGFLLDYTLSSKTITLSNAANENNYSNQTVPIVSVNTSTKVITSNQPIKYTLFSKTKATLEQNLNTIEEFNHTLNASPTIGVTLSTATKDYYLGFINAYGISGLIQF